MPQYRFIEQDEDGDIRAYLADAPYVQRDQGSRAADDTVRVIIGDVSDILADSNSPETQKACALYEEACALFSDDSSGWVDTDENEDAPEHLQDILQEAENLPNVSVHWDGEMGTVLVTLADKWQTFTEDEARAAGIETDAL